MQDLVPRDEVKCPAGLYTSECGKALYVYVPFTGKFIWGRLGAKCWSAQGSQESLLRLCREGQRSNGLAGVDLRRSSSSSSSSSCSGSQYLLGVGVGRLLVAYDDYPGIGLGSEPHACCFCSRGGTFAHCVDVVGPRISLLRPSCFLRRSGTPIEQGAGEREAYCTLLPFRGRRLLTL